MVSPLMINNIKYGTYIVWACTNFAFIPIVYFFSMHLSAESDYIDHTS
jgi:hypothetical protein